MKRDPLDSDENASPTKRQASSRFFSEPPKLSEIEVILNQLLPIVQMWDSILLYTIKGFVKYGPEAAIIIIGGLQHNIKVISQKYAQINNTYINFDLRDKMKEHIETNPAAKKAYYVISRINSMDLSYSLINNMKKLGQDYLRDVLNILNNLLNENTALLSEFSRIQIAIRDLVYSKDTDDSEENLNIIYKSMRNFALPLREIKASQDRMMKNLEAKMKVVSQQTDGNPILKFVQQGLSQRLLHLKESRDLIKSSYIRCIEEIEEIKTRVENQKASHSNAKHLF